MGNINGRVVTGSGRISGGAFTLTVPATGTAALLGAANVFTHATGNKIAYFTFSNDLIISQGSAKLASLNATEEVTLQQGGTPILSVKPTTGFIGISSTTIGFTPVTRFHVKENDAATNVITNVVTIGHNTSGTPAAGLGTGLVFQIEAAAIDTQAARLAALWNDASASYKGDLVAYASDSNAEREGMRIRGTGAAAAIGFLGAAPVVQAAHIADPAGGGTVDAEARTAINAILVVLENLGFNATS